MKYKGLLLDYDGTVAAGGYDGSGQKHISEKVKSALKKVGKKYKVGFCSGRKYSDFKNHIEELELEGPHICCGGSQVVKRDGEVIWEKLINAKTTKAVFEYFSKKGKVVHIKQGEYQYIEKKHFPAVRNVYGNYLNLKEIDQMKDWSVQSMVVVDISEREVERLEEMGVFAVKHKLVRYKGFQAEVTARGVNKQKGILEWLKHAGLDRDEVVAVGDGYNDYPMLEAVGKPVAMGNAVEELKEAADFVCRDIENDGVVEVIEKYFKFNV